MRLKAAFTLHTRSTKQGAVWHVSWYDKDGLRHTQSTGQPVKPALKDRGRVLAERAALQIVHTIPRKIPTLQEYAGAFFDWQKSTFIKRQHAKGRSFNRHWAQELQGLLDTYVFPRFGSARLDAIIGPSVENWLIDLEKLSNQSRNHILLALRPIFKEAKRERLIDRNPQEDIEQMARKGCKRDIFSIPEIRLLFPSDPAELLKVWGQPKYAALYLTMATTGIREGEARALKWKHVLSSGWIVVERAVKVDGTIGALKKRERTGEPRVVALPARTRETLSWWNVQSEHGAPDDLVFFGDRADHPLNTRTFQKILARALNGEHSEHEKTPARIAQGRTVSHDAQPAPHLQHAPAPGDSCRRTPGPHGTSRQPYERPVRPSRRRGQNPCARGSPASD
jgi:integrase